MKSSRREDSFGSFLKASRKPPSQRSAEKEGAAAGGGVDPIGIVRLLSEGRQPVSDLIRESLMSLEDFKLAIDFLTKSGLVVLAAGGGVQQAELTERGREAAKVLG